MYYIFGDIHGCLDRLVSLYGQVEKRLGDDDILIFLGDYIDRGGSSYEVVEYLLELREQRPNIRFLKGNHEVMLFEFLNGNDPSGNYLYNGGNATRKSYDSHVGGFVIPENHRDFFNRLLNYYEGDDFIAVHAGLNPEVNSPEAQSLDDLVWIREDFFRSPKRWKKTVIFGHTPTYYIHGKWGKVYMDDVKNIIGIDTGAVYGGMLTCLVWPEKKILQV